MEKLTDRVARKLERLSNFNVIGSIESAFGVVALKSTTKTWITMNRLRNIFIFFHIMKIKYPFAPKTKYSVVKISQHSAHRFTSSYAKWKIHLYQSILFGCDVDLWFSMRLHFMYRILITISIIVIKFVIIRTIASEPRKKNWNNELTLIMDSPMISVPFSGCRWI